MKTDVTKDKIEKALTDATSKFKEICDEADIENTNVVFGIMAMSIVTAHILEELIGREEADKMGAELHKDLYERVQRESNVEPLDVDDFLEELFGEQSE